jgi:hypothetical protein
LIPWWDEGATGPACDDASWLVPPGSLDCLAGEDVAGVTIRSVPNPMSSLIDSFVGIVLLGAFPIVSFAALCAYGCRVLRPERASSRQAPPMAPLLRASVLGNIIIMGALVLLYVFGGGTFGLLLPDMRKQFKMANITSLAGTSAAIDLLLSLFLGKVIRQEPQGKRPHAGGLVCAASMVGLDVLQTFCFAKSWPGPLVSQQVLPGILLVAELCSSTFLAWRCFCLQQQVHQSMLDHGSDERMRGLNRRLVASGVRFKLAALLLRRAALPASP